MSSTGYLQVRAFESYAQIPLKDVAVSVTDSGGRGIALRLTNRSGLLDEPIEIDVPDLSAGQSPNTGIIPFTSVNLTARLENYELIRVNNVQVFPDTVTVQNLELIPLSEFPDEYTASETFDTPAQRL